MINKQEPEDVRLVIIIPKDAKEKIKAWGLAQKPKMRMGMVVRLAIYKFLSDLPGGKE